MFSYVGGELHSAVVGLLFDLAGLLGIPDFEVTRLLLRGGGGGGIFLVFAPPPPTSRPELTLLSFCDVTLTSAIFTESSLKETRCDTRLL